MAFSPKLFQTSIPRFSYSPQILTRNPLLVPSIRAVKASDQQPDNKDKLTQPKPQDSSNAQPTTTPPRPKKPVYSMKKGQIVRVDKEKYLNSINYLSVGHPPYYKGLDYIYEDRGEIAWVGIPTAPAWLPTDMLIKVHFNYVVTNSLVAWARITDKYSCTVRET
ncbi:NAD(P)H-quinone oxidoreductase subunit O, chloroplastic isoform X2 [Ziziphus jujuba]|uniref:NAD(P)H-quinone oxidoreductase subunit O, chloroplastic isoform X2 n=1 Tax=Ziziphus jujuba TaxID=326968 RepID=A0ABM4ADD6_ZIZJJ|nr:NAD(P)H-quinone oxidoreductase subunit O, chloroplastic isoform X2 [Ziziphus jujuba]